MCLPVPVLMLLASSASAIAQHQAASDAADNQAKAIQQTRDLERMDATRQQQLAYEAAAGEANAHAMQANKDMASFEALAGESGGGLSMTRGLTTMGIQNGQDMATLASNSRTKGGDIAMGDIASGVRATSSMASVQRPSSLQTGLTIAGAAMKYRNDMDRMSGGKAFQGGTTEATSTVRRPGAL